jgi:hypothetical protein
LEIFYTQSFQLTATKVICLIYRVLVDVRNSRLWDESSNDSNGLHIERYKNNNCNVSTKKALVIWLVPSFFFFVYLYIFLFLHSVLLLIYSISSASLFSHFVYLSFGKRTDLRKEENVRKLIHFFSLRLIGEYIFTEFYSSEI